MHYFENLINKTKKENPHFSLVFCDFYVKRNIEEKEE